MAGNKNTVTITYDGGNNELFWKKSAGVSGNRVDVLVPETHYAVAIKDGKYLDTLSGGKFTVSEKSRKIMTSTDVVFMSKTHKLRILWGTKNRISFTDSSTGESFGLGASGEYEVQISSPKHFYLELVGMDEVYDSAKLKDRLQSKILAVIEHELRNIINLYKWNGKALPSYKQKISEALHTALSRMLELDYGLRLCSFLITNIVSVYDNDIKEKEKASDKSDKKDAKSAFCMSCGVEISKSDNYCFNCGTKILSAAAEKQDGQTLLQINYCPRCGKPESGGNV